MSSWRAGLHRSNEADIERGARNASLPGIEELAKALKLLLSVLFEPLGTSANAGATTEPPGRSGLMEILLVEDDPSDLELTLEAFQAARLNNRVHVVHDGAEAYFVKPVELHHLIGVTPRLNCSGTLLPGPAAHRPSR